MVIKWISDIFKKIIRFRIPRKKTKPTSKVILPTDKIKSLEASIVEIADWVNCIDKRLASEKKQRSNRIKRLEKEFDRALDTAVESIDMRITEILETSHGSGKQISGTARAYQN